ncbi:MAG: hypothetical protein ACLRX7_06900 [Acutalibacteraceae bacterium]
MEYVLEHIIKGVSADDNSLSGEAYDNYYGGKAKVNKIEVSKITDGDTLTMALQNGRLMQRRAIF